jgi:hypothetical protein
MNSLKSVVARFFLRHVSRPLAPLAQPFIEAQVTEHFNPLLALHGIVPLNLEELAEGSKFAVRAISEAA